jgi:hypothetical protein
MSTSVLERPAPAAELTTAELKWERMRAALARQRILVLLARTYDLHDEIGSVHILALTDVRYGPGRTRFLPGLDVQYTPFPAESASLRSGSGAPATRNPTSAPRPASDACACASA